MIRSYVHQIPQRVRIAIAAFCMQLALGTVYGWSVFLAPLRAHFDASKAEVTLTFTITLAVLGVTAGFGGSLQRRIGPRATATLAGILYGSGVFLSGFAQSLIGLYLAHGVLGGIGLGLGYIVPLAVLVAWFPDKRGSITGLAVAGFGLGALVVSPLATELIRTHGVQHTLLLLGTAYLAVVVAAAQFLRRAPDDYAPPGWTPQPPSAAGADPTLADALRTPHWHLQWWMLALNVTAGAALISVAAPLVQELGHVGPALGAAAVCLISLANGVGRLAWGAISDAFGRCPTFAALFALQALAFAAMPTLHDFVWLLIPIATIALCYGGGFGTMPAFVADIFGAKNSGTVYGAMLTAWSAGAIAGPLLIAALPYRTALLLIGGLLIAAMPLPLMFYTIVRRNESGIAIGSPVPVGYHAVGNKSPTSRTSSPRSFPHSRHLGAGHANEGRASDHDACG